MRIGYGYTPRGQQVSQILRGDDEDVHGLPDYYRSTETQMLVK